MKTKLPILFTALIIGVVSYYYGANSAPGSEFWQKKHSCETLIEVIKYGGASLPKNSYSSQRDSILDKENVIATISAYQLSDLYNTNEESLAKTISENLSIEQEKGTDLIKIRINSVSEERAQQIAYVFIHTYHDRILQLAKDKRDKKLAILNQKILLQEQQFEATRKKLYDLAKSLGIPYYGVNVIIPERISDNSITKSKEFNDAKDKYEKENILMDTLQNERMNLMDEGWNSPYQLIRIHQTNWTDDVAKQMQARKLAK
mgnify:CR=1 FL=1